MNTAKHLLEEIVSLIDMAIWTTEDQTHIIINKSSEIYESFNNNLNEIKYELFRIGYPTESVAYANNEVEYRIKIRG